LLAAVAPKDNFHLGRLGAKVRLLESFACKVPFVPKRQMLHYQQVVDRFDEVARANIERPMHIADLCRAAGVTPRTLSRAFQAVRGKPPSRYLHELRLVQIRNVLLSSAGNGSVTDIAMRFGFRELGRFAVDYRARFGESPSETLRRGSSGGR
jgi:transcriptional regulator GlxA family with amidase domain